MGQLWLTRRNLSLSLSHVVERWTLEQNNGYSHKKEPKNGCTVGNEFCHNTLLKINEV